MPYVRLRDVLLKVKEFIEAERYDKARELIDLALSCSPAMKAFEEHDMGETEYAELVRLAGIE